MHRKNPKLQLKYILKINKMAFVERRPFPNLDHSSPSDYTVILVNGFLIVITCFYSTSYFVYMYHKGLTNIVEQKDNLVRFY